MKKIFRQLSFVVLALGLVLLAGGRIGWAKHTNGPKTVVYVVGDSLSDPGNLYALTGFWPPSPPYAQRNCNGPVWTEYLAAKTGTSVDSRAYGGALSGVFLINGFPVSNFNSVQDPPNIPDLPGVSEEIDALLNEFPAGLNPDSLYVVWAGANDFFLGLVQPENLSSILAQTVANVGESVCRLSAAGARHFVVGNMPDIGLTPLAQSLGPEYQAQFTQVIAQFNAGLTQAVTSLEGYCAESITIFDTYQVLQKVSTNPKTYGLKNGTDACLTFDAEDNPLICKKPDKYLFWDSVHPTTAGQEILANEFLTTVCGFDKNNVHRKGGLDESLPPAWRELCFEAKWRNGDLHHIFKKGR